MHRNACFPWFPESLTRMEKLLNKRNTLILVGLLTAWRLYLSSELQLHPDEAYYWLWSRHLDIGYFDHPPLVAYFIWLTTQLSTSELWVRLSSTMVSLAVSGLLWQLSIQLFRSIPIAAGSVILFNVFPLSMLGLFVMTPDVPVFFFWSISLFVFWQIIRSGQSWLWYILGLLFGLALLSKYTAILMVPCLFLFLAFTDERRWLKTRYPYLAALIGLSCFLPVLYWNSLHDWVSFRFQMSNGLGGEGYALSNVAEYIGGQLLVAGPVTWVLGTYAALVGLFRRDKKTLFLIAATVPVLVFFGLSSFKKAASPNWPASAYFTFSILVTYYCLDGYSRVRRSLWSAAVVSSLALSTLTTLHARFNVIPLDRYSADLVVNDTTNAFRGWRELGAEIKSHPEQKTVITPSHQLSAEIIYYTQESVFVQTAQNARPSQFNLWPQPSPDRGDTRVYVWNENHFIGHGASFAAQSNAFDVYRSGHAVRRYYTFLGEKTKPSPFPAS